MTSRHHPYLHLVLNIIHLTISSKILIKMVQIFTASPIFPHRRISTYQPSTPMSSVTCIDQTVTWQGTLIQTCPPNPKQEMAGVVNSIHRHSYSIAFPIFNRISIKHPTSGRDRIPTLVDVYQTMMAMLSTQAIYFVLLVPNLIKIILLLSNMSPKNFHYGPIFHFH